MSYGNENETENEKQMTKIRYNPADTKTSQRRRKNVLILVSKTS